MNLRFFLIVMMAALVFGCHRQADGPRTSDDQGRLSVNCLDSRYSFEEPCIDEETAAQNHCLSVGGQALAFTSSSGPIAYCGFGDAWVEQRSLYQTQEKQKTAQAVSAFLDYVRPVDLEGDRLTDPDTPLPDATADNEKSATDYCAKVGGQIQTVSDDSGTDMDSCVFADKSAIEAVTLFRGPNDSRNSRLTDVLFQTSLYEFRR